MLRTRIDKKLVAVFIVAIVSVLAGMGVVQTMSSSTAITFTSPTNGGTLPAGSLTVSGHIQATGPIRAFVELSNQGRAAELQLVPTNNGYDFNFTFQDCPEGSYIITVIVITPDGGVLATSTIRVTLHNNSTTVTPLPAGQPVPCGVQPCTPPPASCGNPCPVPPTPTPVTVTVPAFEAPPPQVVIISQPPQPVQPPILVKVEPPRQAPPPIVVLDQPAPPPPPQIRRALPAPPSAPPPVTYQAPAPPSAPPPVITIDRQVPPTSDTAPCNCEEDQQPGGGWTPAPGPGPGPAPVDSFFDDP